MGVDLHSLAAIQPNQRAVCLGIAPDVVKTPLAVGRATVKGGTNINPFLS